MLLCGWVIHGGQTGRKGSLVTEGTDDVTWESWKCQSFGDGGRKVSGAAILVSRGSWCFAGLIPLKLASADGLPFG